MTGINSFLREHCESEHDIFEQKKNQTHTERLRTTRINVLKKDLKLFYVPHGNRNEKKAN